MLDKVKVLEVGALGMAWEDGFMFKAGSKEFSYERFDTMKK